MTQPTGPDGTTPPDRGLQRDSSGNLIRPEGMSDEDFAQLQRDLLANTGSADGIEPTGVVDGTDDNQPR